MKNNGKITKSKSIIARYRPYLVPVAAFAIIAIIIILLAVQTTGMSLALSKLIDNSSKTSEDIDAIVQTLLIETKHMNEFRSELGLSEIVFPIESLLERGKDGGSESASTLPYFRAIDRLYGKVLEEKGRKAFMALLENGALKSFLKEEGLSIKNIDPLTVSLSRGALQYFLIRYEPDSGTLEIESIFGDKIEDADLGSPTLNKLGELSTQIDGRYSVIEASVSAILEFKENEKLVASLKEKDLAIALEENTIEKYTLAVFRKKTVYLRFGLIKRDAAFYIDERKYSTFDGFSRDLLSSVLAIDTRAENEKLVDKLDSELESVFNEKAFKTLLDIKKLSISPVRRLDDYFMYRDVMDISGKRIGSFAIDKSRPNIYLMDKDDVQISSINALLEPEPPNVVKKN